VITTHLTAEHLAQLDALLADTTPGGGVYRPPVARDINLLSVLADRGLVLYTSDCGYEITDDGRAIVMDRAVDAANTHVFVLYATDDELHAAIGALKVAADTADDVVRDRALTDIEACQDELDRRDADGQSESTGRHRAVPPDDRPTETIARVELPTEQLPFVGTLPAIPVTKILDDREGAERLLAAIQDTPSPDDVAEYLAEPHTADEWAALAADLGDEPGWWNRSIVPGGVLIVSVFAAVVITWFAAWLVMG